MTLQDIITTIGIPAIILSLIYIGRKLQTLDTLEKTVDALAKTARNIGRHLIRVEERVNILWKDKLAPIGSPRRLNELGKKILEESGIKQILDQKRSDLLARVKELAPANPYDAERVILTVVDELPEYSPEILPPLKDWAFKAGQDVATALLVGGFYLRDLIFADLGFSITELDRPSRKK